MYGLTELHRDDIRNARLVANPGCYPTAIQFLLVPLVKAKLIKVTNIIIDAKSGDVGLRKQIFTLKLPKVSTLME